MLKLSHDLSNQFGGKKENKELDDLIDAKILDIGIDKSGICKEGGLSIDYKNKKGETKRIIFGYTELGIWIENVSKIDIDNYNDTIIVDSLHHFIEYLSSAVVSCAEIENGNYLHEELHLKNFDDPTKRLIGFEIVETGYKIQIPLTIIKKDSVKHSNWSTEQKRLKMGNMIVRGLCSVNEKCEFIDRSIDDKTK